MPLFGRHVTYFFFAKQYSLWVGWAEKKLYSLDSNVSNVTKRTYGRFYFYAQISLQNFMAAMGHYKKI